MVRKVGGNRGSSGWEKAEDYGREKGEVYGWESGGGLRWEKGEGYGG